MAISIAAGLISATVMILVVLPCIILVFDDIKGILHFLWFGEQRKPEQVQASSHAATVETA